MILLRRDCSDDDGDVNDDDDGDDDEDDDDDQPFRSCLSNTVIYTYIHLYITTSIILRLLLLSLFCCNVLTLCIY